MGFGEGERGGGRGENGMGEAKHTNAIANRSSEGCIGLHRIES